MDNDLKDEVRALFQSNILGLYPVAVTNGADEYHCPGCDSYTQIKGYAMGTEHVTMFEHGADCKLYALYKTVTQD